MTSFSRGVLLGILRWAVPPGSPNPDPSPHQKNSSSTPFFRPGLQAESISSLLTFERKQKILQIHLEFAYFSFLLTHLELKR